eukprot:gnl/MRDRNA2_/MRDRNA2_120748_c0_seq1.p1 gnl/MRDRNA2_/MRDRNA2_120748_c0~~gnl/MRDRNA2_/MRDRNA2_120748_c0_seq1.p1  ORF type:complete len:103 (+),score=11.72 gnl/MRDRNA2_/MRDRNA2_120748_c0_seq1:345-653(+)
MGLFCGQSWEKMEASSRSSSLRIGWNLWERGSSNYDLEYIVQAPAVMGHLRMKLCASTPRRTARRGQERPASCLLFSCFSYKKGIQLNFTLIRNEAGEGLRG